MKTSLTTLLSFIFLIFISYSYAQNNTLDFDGGDDVVTTSLDPNMNTWTVECWVLGNNVPSTSNIERVIDGGYNFCINWGHGNSDFRGAIEFYNDAESTPHIGADTYVAASFGTLQAGVWYHLAGTYDGLNLKAYKNGVLITDNDWPDGNPEPQTRNMTVGANAANTSPFSGKIDEIRIWNDVRSETELRSNMYQELNAASETNLVAYYKMNSSNGTTAVDSKNSYDGTLTNMANNWLPSPAFFGPKNSLDFDGSNDYISIPSDASLNNNAFSVEFWVYYNGQPSFYNGIIDKGRDIGGGNGNDWWFLTVPGEAGIFGCTGTELWYGIEYNKWTHVAGTYDGSTMKVYVNGILQNSQSKAYTASSNGIVIGRRTSGSSYFKGNLDEVRIWNTSRTAQQIRENMNKSLSGNENGLVAYYNLDNSNGTTLQDFSGNNNDGSLNNMDNSDWVSSTAFNTWLNTNSTLWSASFNWSRGSVPGSSDNVHVEQLTALPANSSDLTLNNFVLASSSSLDFTGSMTISGNAFFYSPYTIYSGKGMTVEGDFFFDNSKSTAFTVKSGGSLITNGNVSGSINIEHSMTDNYWHLVSVPVSGLTANQFFGDYLQYFDESLSDNNYIDIEDESTILNDCQGYAWRNYGKSDFTFSGTPNTGEKSIALTANNVGWNLIGNPYPSAIDWDVLNDTYGAIYIWNPTTDDYIEWNGASEYGVAPMQAFFVKALSGGTFTIDDNARTHTNANGFYKSDNISIENGIVLSTNQSDRLTIRFAEEAKPDFDLIYDAFKIVSLGENNSQLYSKYYETKLAIDCRPETDIIQLGYQNNQNGDYTIELQDSDGITAELEDSKLNQFHDLTKGPYSFDWETNDSEERFILHLKATGTDDLDEQDIHVYSANGQLYIKMNQNDTFDQLIIYDLAARVITEKTIQAYEIQSFDLSHLKGTYLVQLKSSTNSITKKIIIN